MVRIGDGTGEYIYYEFPLPVEIRDLLVQAGPNLLAAVKSAHDTCQTLNVSPEVLEMIGPEGSQALTGMRTQLVFRLMVFRDHLLPLSKNTVRAVRETLTYYFQHVSFEEFKTILPTLKGKIQPHTERTGLTKNKFMFLKAELETLKADSTNELTRIIPSLEKVLRLQGEAGDEFKRDAQRAGTVASVAGCLASTKGFIISVGTMILAVPALAPIVAAVVVFVAEVAQITAAKNKEQLEKQGKCLRMMCSELSKAIVTLEDINSRGIKNFTDCLQGCADFFSYLESQLETLSSPEGEDAGDDVLRIMHRSLKSEASQAIKACREYDNNASQVETGIQVLEQFKPARYEALLEEWIISADAKAAELKRREVICTKPSRSTQSRISRVLHIAMYTLLIGIAWRFFWPRAN